MNTLLDLIKSFQESSNLVVNEFYKIYNRRDLLRAYRDKTIHKEGKLNDIVIEYSFHGGGLYAKLKDREIDFDFGPDYRTDGFDAWRLKEFARSQDCPFSHWSTEEFQNQLDKLEAEQIISNPKTYPGTSNYYLQNKFS